MEAVLRLALLMSAISGGLNVWALRFKDVQDYHILLGVVIGVASFSLVLAGVIALILEFL